jgi:tetratricopeptide (TPR) repeat protein
MRQFFQALLFILALAHSAYGAEISLRIELPDMQLLLPPVTPPQLQREGASLPGEQILIRDELAPLVASGEYEAALSQLRRRREWLLNLLESGDPGEELHRRAVPGGLNFGIGSGLVSSALLFLTGHVYFALEQYMPAENAFKAALVVLPDYARAHESLGLLYTRMERYEDSRAHLTRAIVLGTNTPTLFGALGYVNHQTRSHWAAASAFQQALMMEPANRNWQRGLLHSLTETDQYRSGRALVAQMLQQTPDDPDLWVYRSHLSLLDDQRAAALASLETAIRLGDVSVANLQACATLHMERGSVARAVEFLRRAYDQGMEYQFVDQALLWLAQQDQWDNFGSLLATAAQQRASLTSVEQSKLLTREASFHLHNDERRSARTALEEAVGSDPSNAEALMDLAQLYGDDRDYARAEVLFQRASAFDRYRENALLSMAQLAINQEDFERALRLLRDILDANPTRIDLRRNIEALESLVRLRAD